MKMTHHPIRIVLILHYLLAANALAHDFWLEAAPFYTERGQTVDVSVLVGNEYVGESLPNIFNWYSDFSLYQPGAKKNIDGELGRDPAGYFVAEQEGTYAIGYQSTYTYTEIDSDTFNKYLREEGLQHAIDYRAKNGLTQAEAKENYIRHAKALVQSGDSFVIDHSTLKFGYDLEIVPVDNPYRKRLNDMQRFQVLYNDQPASDLLLIAFSKHYPEKTQRVRSDAKGMATIRLNDSGPWIVKAVKILRLQGEKADWKSHWASLTFAVR